MSESQNNGLKLWQVLVVLALIAIPVWAIIVSNQVEHDKDRAREECEDDIDACIEGLEDSGIFDDLEE